MSYKFRKAELPYNKKDDFKTSNISVDIICRVWLSEAPSKKHEEVAKKMDENNYKHDNFFIESVVGKNEPDGDFLTSEWLLYYMLDDEEVYEFGYIGDLLKAFKFFKEEIGVEF